LIYTYGQNVNYTLTYLATTGYDRFMSYEPVRTARSSY